MPGGFERVANLAVCGKRQPFLGHGGPGNVTAQAFEFVALIGFRRNPGMQGSLWNPDTGRQWTPIKPKRKSDECKQLGFWRRSRAGTLTVKPTKTGSWFALIAGEMVTQHDDTPIWFRSADEAKRRIEAIQSKSSVC